MLQKIKYVIFLFNLYFYFYLYGLFFIFIYMNFCCIIFQLKFMKAWPNLIKFGKIHVWPKFKESCRCLIFFIANVPRIWVSILLFCVHHYYLHFLFSSLKSKRKKSMLIDLLERKTDYFFPSFIFLAGCFITLCCSE